MVYERLLAPHDFMCPETPYNIPVGSCLTGKPRMQLFDANDLNAGFKALLSFQTPVPREPKEGEEIQVYLRCLNAGSGVDTNAWKHYWPNPVKANINGHAINLKRAQSEDGVVGIDMPANITPLLHKYHHKYNVVTMERNKGSPERPITDCVITGTFVIVVQEFYIMSNELLFKQVLKSSKNLMKIHFRDLRDNIARRTKNRKSEVALSQMSLGTLAIGGTPGSSGVKQEGERSYSYFELEKDSVVQYMKSDEEILLDMIRVSLLCPLSRTRIKIPVKSASCTHVQCFDLESYLSYMRHTPVFRCPVCETPEAILNNLVESPYIMEALKKFSCNEIDIAADGSMSAVIHERIGAQSNKMGDEGDDAGYDADDDDDDEAGDDPGDSYGNVIGASGGASADCVVDLTLSDVNENEGQDAALHPEGQDAGMHPEGAAGNPRAGLNPGTADARYNGDSEMETGSLKYYGDEAPAVQQAMVGTSDANGQSTVGNTNSSLASTLDSHMLIPDLALDALSEQQIEEQDSIAAILFDDI